MFQRRWKDADYLEVWRPHNWAGGRKFRQSDKQERVMCKRAFTGPIQILADGSMIVCCFDTDGVLKIGDTYKNSIEYILDNSLELRKLRKIHQTGKLEGFICNSCDQRFVYDESPLLYSNEQEDDSLNRTSITKVKLDEERTALCGTSCG